MCGWASRLKRMRSIASASVAVPTVERGLDPIRSWSTLIAVVSPSRTSTSGRASVGMKPCTKALYVSLISRWDSAAIVPNTSELLPEPETPVNTVNRRFGISTLTSLRLFSRAPSTRIRSWLSATRGACGGACGRASDLVAVLIVLPSVSSCRCLLVGVASAVRVGGAPARSDRLARRPLHELADPRLFGGAQLLQREGDRPHGALVEVRRVVEAERRVPRVELLGALKVADDLAVLVGVGGHPVPGLGREGGRVCLDALVEPPGHGAGRS